MPLDSKRMTALFFLKALMFLVKRERVCLEKLLQFVKSGSLMVHCNPWERTIA